MLVEGQTGRINDPNAEMCRGTTRAAKYRTQNKSIQKHDVRGARLSDLVVAVAGFLLATDPTLAALLTTRPGATFYSNGRVFDWAITVDGGYVAAEVMLAGKGSPAGWVWASVGLRPVRVVGFPVGLEVEGPSEGSRTVGALVLLLRIVGHQIDLLLTYGGKVWFR